MSKGLCNSKLNPTNVRLSNACGERSRTVEVSKLLDTPVPIILAVLGNSGLVI